MSAMKNESESDKHIGQDLIPRLVFVQRKVFAIPRISGRLLLVDLLESRSRFHRGTQDWVVIEDMMRQGLTSRRPVSIQECGQNFAMLPNCFNGDFLLVIFPLKQQAVVPTLTFEEITNVGVISQ